MQKPLLQIDSLQVEFVSDTGSQVAVKNLSVAINRGEILALVGESGSGKSVTSLSILGLLSTRHTRYPSGKILFSSNGSDSVDLLELTEEELQDIRGKKIAMIFQEPMSSLNPVFTCGDQVTESILAHNPISSREARERTLDLFDKVQLPDPSTIYHRYPHQLSGGQKQRVMIAMAISSNPQLLICDEPTTALDVTVQKTILVLIRKLQQEFGMGVIFITHDLGIVAELADRVAVLLKGTLVETGTVKEIFSNPGHAYTKALLACRPSLHPKGKRLPIVSDYMGQDLANDGMVNFRAIEPKIHEKPAVASSSLIEVRNLSVVFEGRKKLFGASKPGYKAVNDVSFTIRAGETVGLVGESGCGKTTLGRSILQLVKPSSGSILYKGADITLSRGRELKKLRREIQIVFQDPYGSLNPKITVGRAIEEAMIVHHLMHDPVKRKSRVMELLEKVNLQATHFNRYPHEFSGGQRQRIVIARALALSPSLIVCDESVSALDVSVQAQVLNLLNDLKAEFGFTCLFISHDLSVVRYISDRILVMQAGKILESGDAEEIYRNPKSPYTQKLLQSIPGYQAHAGS